MTNLKSAPVLQEPSKPVRTRKRGFSFRTQVPPQQQSQLSSPSLSGLQSQSQLQITSSKSSRSLSRPSPPSSSSSSSSAAAAAEALRSQPHDSTSQDIELREVDQTYAPGDWQAFRNSEESEDSNTTSDSLDHQGNRGGIHGHKFRPFGSHVTNDSVMELGDSPSYRVRTTTRRHRYSRWRVIKRLKNLLLGISEPIPSIGGRMIPITVDLNRVSSTFPTTRDHKGRHLLIDERKGRSYLSNTITSSKYTLFSFLPRQLFAQFSKLANCYFFIVAIMQLIPTWSTTGTTTTIIPLSVFVSISIAREGWDDLRRHRLDKQENEHIANVLKEGAQQHHMKPYRDHWFSRRSSSLSRGRSQDDPEESLEPQSSSSSGTMTPNSFVSQSALAEEDLFLKKTKWKDIKVGDIVKLECDEWVPADVVLLTSTNDLGETFVETMALDGETNLKSRIPNPELHCLANTAKSLHGINATVRSEDPNLDLYNYEGSLEMADSQTGQRKEYPLGPESVIYRGSVIRNTDACLGLVIFTGEETKIRMNAIKRPRIKAPKLQKSINTIVIFMVCLVVLLSAFSMMGERLLYKKDKAINWYIYQQDVGVAATLMGYIIMLNTMIPLSLYVTMEIIKIMQMVLLQWDIDMYDPESNTPAEARTATILEELGQVSYVFSDKTGTLTDNKMLFRKFSVAGTAWIHDVDKRIEAEEMLAEGEDNTSSPIFRARSMPVPSLDVLGMGAAKFTSRPSTAASLAMKKGSDTQESTILSQILSPSNQPEELRSSVELIQYIQRNPKTLFAQKVTFFLLSVALCHTCLPKRNSEPEEAEDDGDETSDLDAINYQASSPDELALVQAASDMGFIFFDRKREHATLKLYPSGLDQQPVLEHYEVLDTVDFSSSRKRMSVIVRFPDGKIYMICKGADNIIMEKLKARQLAEAKQEQLAKTVTERKQIEADMILSRRSNDIRPTGRASGISIPSLARPSGLGQRQQQKLSMSSLAENEAEERQVDEVVAQSRRSINLKQKQKFREQAYVPSDQLLGNEEFLIEKTLQHVEEFSSDGLRTLLYAYRPIEEDAFQEWEKEYSAAKTAVKNRSDKVEKTGGKLENGLLLLGCTAIEDKLQDGVPETIEKLRRAGMKMWMLTGDKRETAINIGYSCRLIKDYSKVVILSQERSSLAELSSMMNAAEIEIDEGNVAHCVVVIDGGTLSAIDKDLTLMSVFISLGVKADSVICCRASPSQKAGLVGQVRSLRKGQVTLAVGDGANDIAMIQNADVGVGITGREGLQAARAADYSVARFRFLQKLLLVHGRYNYVRTSKFVLCTFYKELMFYLTQLLYQRYTLFTGSSLYEPWSLSMFNTLFTSLIVMFVGMFDMDLRPSTLIAVPELYAIGRCGQAFNLKVFLQWVVLSASQSVSLFFTLVTVFGFNATIDNTTYPLGVALYTAMVILICSKCCIIEVHNISKLPLIAWSISVFGWLLWLVLLVGLNKNRIQKIFYVNYGLFYEFGRDVTFWATILALTFVGLFLDLIYHFVQSWIRTTDTDAFQQLEKDPVIRERLELAAYRSLKQGWTWFHDSQIDDKEVKQWTRLRRNFYYFRSFMRKGSIHQSKATRKRSSTMVNPNEPPPGSPSIVKLASSDRYVEEMLPSGAIVRIKKTRNDTVGSRRPRSKSVRFTGMFHGGKNAADEEERENADIDAILERRMKDLEEQ
ncbi:DEKNAAC102220 [Brettanomyces naardenensis]|uniref:Phospholipid-transporting ATPase n=1 Tax=Brettanomyces naardenensis TaxID=13370 RepID=A0A448YLH3_BRENA|nr:DEKNAAC102220 [Brettanomyces naardenensis]